MVIANIVCKRYDAASNVMLLTEAERDANAMGAEGRKYDVSRAIRCKKPSLEESRQSIASKVCK